MTQVIRKTRPLNLIPVADGFIDDCNELQRRCLQADEVSFQLFCNIWKDMDFAYVFQGKSIGAELAEFTEDCVKIAKKFMFAKTNNFEETVVGVFLVYALLKLQPFVNFAALRLTPDDVDTVIDIQTKARSQRRHDVLYILGNILIDGPCEFHAAERMFGLERSYNKQSEGVSADTIGNRCHRVLSTPNEELAALRELASLSRRYASAKSALHGGVKPDRTLSYTDEHMASELAASLKQLSYPNTKKEEKSEGDMIKSIKQRALTDTVTQIRHLSSIHDKEKSPKKRASTPAKSKRPRKKNGQKRKKQYEVEIAIPQHTSKSPKKLVNSEKMPKKKRQKIVKSKKEISSDSEEDSTSLPSSDSVYDADSDNTQSDDFLDNTNNFDDYLKEYDKLQCADGKQYNAVVCAVQRRSPRNVKATRTENTPTSSTETTLNSYRGSKVKAKKGARVNVASTMRRFGIDVFADVTSKKKV